MIRFARNTTFYYVISVKYSLTSKGVSIGGIKGFIILKHHSWEPEVEVIHSLIVLFILLRTYMWAYRQLACAHSADTIQYGTPKLTSIVPQRARTTSAMSSQLGKYTINL